MEDVVQANDDDDENDDWEDCDDGDDEDAARKKAKKAKIAKAVAEMEAGDDEGEGDSSVDELPEAGGM